MRCSCYISRATNENREWNPANCLMRGKNMNDEVGIGCRSASDWLRGGGSFLDHRVKQITTNRIPDCFWHVTENCSFDICIVATFFFSFSQAIIESLGAERRNRVLSGLYMGRSDVSLMVRQAALHVWKVVVPNTPRILREILPTLFSLLLGCLASTSYDKRQVSVACYLPGHRRKCGCFD